jgi:MOSC domain-containing protein
MAVVGRVESLWRYPVKSMRGEELREAFLGFAGVSGDRIYAFRSTAASEGFFCHTGGEQEQILLGCPEHMLEQPNLPEDEATLRAALSVYSDPDNVNL